MYTQKLLVHDSSKWQGAERFHTCFVDLFRIFMLAFQFEREVVCEMSAFMVSPKQPQRVGVPDL